MQSPSSSIFLSVGGFDIYYYGLIMGIAVVIGFFVAVFVSKNKFQDVSTDEIVDLSTYLVLGAILGARIYYVLMSFSYYFDNPLEIFMLHNGGLSIHGGILGGVVSGLLWAKINRKNFLKYADVMTFGLVAGQIVGRFGNYFNAEAFGKPCELPWGLYIPLLKRPIEYASFEYFHPAFLYEAIWNLFVLFLLFFILKKFRKYSNGKIFFSYMMLYSLGRIFIEFVRIDSVLNVFGIPVAVLASVLMFLFGGLGLIFVISKDGHSMQD